LYEKLEKEIIPLYYNHPNAWLKMMRSVISLNASYFNTDRVLEDYIKKAYR
jgi:starch phosphorylase